MLSTRLVDGRSKVLTLSEGDYQVVLFKDGEEVLRRWEQIVPGELITIAE